MIILDLSYARLLTTFFCSKRSGPPKIHLSKNQNSYEIIFHDQKDYDDWMLKLRRICVFTNFEKKYQIAQMTEKREDRCVKSDLKEILLLLFLGMFTGNKDGRKSLFRKKIR